MPIFITIVIVSIVAALIISFYPKKQQPTPPIKETPFVYPPIPTLELPDEPIEQQPTHQPYQPIVNVPKSKSKNTAKVKPLAKMEAKKKVKKITDKNKTKKSTKK